MDDRNPTGYAQVLEELDQTQAPIKVYAYGHSLINQSLKGSGSWTINYYGFDGHGNVRFLTDSSAAITDTYTYDAFGVLLARTGNGTDNSYLYCGEQFDFDLGLYYLRARYDNPNAGRLWTMDSFEGDSLDPLSIHKYLYCKASPVSYHDASGHETAVSVSFTTTIGFALTTFELSAANSGLHAAQGIAAYPNITAEGDTEGINDLIYYLDATTIIIDKVTLVTALTGLTYGTVKVVDFLSKNLVRRAEALIGKAAQEVQTYLAKAENYYSYKELKQIIKENGFGSTIESHHLLEKKFAKALGLNKDEIIAYPLPQSQHRNVGGLGVNLDAEINAKLMDLGTVPEDASVEQIWIAHRDAYRQNGHPEWADALFDAYFKVRGIRRD